MSLDIGNLIFWLVIAALLFYVIGIYNKLVSLRNRYKNAFSQIEVQLKRRHDLIPNLVETAKGYLSHERETLQSVIEARQSAEQQLAKAARDPANAQAIQDLSKAETSLMGALGRFNLVVENYPDLKADQTMMQLSEELTSTENRVAFARQSYNDSVMSYNTFRQSFPPVILAPTFGFKDASLLEFEDSDAIQQAPQVKF